MEISPNVHWLETGSSNVYLIVEPPNIVLVDTGILFAGDALNTRNGRVKLPPRITADKTAARQSGIRLLELSPAIIACGHGNPSTKPTADELMPVFNTLRQE